MHAHPRLRFWAGVVVLFTLFAGEAIRNTLSWYGFAAWDGLIFVALVIVALRLWKRGEVAARISSRRPLRGFLHQRATPVVLLGTFVAWAALSIVWSAYPAATLLAIAVQWITTFAAFALYLWLGWPIILRAFTVALQAILVLSFLFELMVAAVIRHPVLPVFPIDVVPGQPVPGAFYWSEGLLFEGGRIQGILGNANLTGFVALLALIVTAGLLAGGQVGRRVGWAGIVLAVAMLAFTNSSTVLVAVVVCALVFALMLTWRRGRRRDGRRPGFWSVVAVVLAAGVTAAVMGPALPPLLGKSEDLTGRIDIWASVANLIAERPALGWGWISYWIPGVKPYDGLAVKNGVSYLQAHNTFLDVTVQLGFIGLVIFVSLLAATVYSVTRYGVPTITRPWILGKLIPSLMLAALLTQALSESRLLVEGNWALLCILALATSTRAHVLPAGSTASAVQTAPRGLTE